MNSSLIIVVVMLVLALLLAGGGGVIVLFAVGMLFRRRRSTPSADATSLATEEVPRGQYPSNPSLPVAPQPPAPVGGLGAPGLGGGGFLGAPVAGAEGDHSATEVFSRPTPGQALWDDDDDDDDDGDKTELFTPGMLADMSDDELGMLMDDTPAPAPPRGKR